MANEDPMDEPYGFEIGPIRPPSEAYSLLVRVMRNCAWNRCLFCPVYKESEFSARSVEHVKRDIDLVHKYILQFRGDPAPAVTTHTAQVVPGEAMAFDMARRWYLSGMKSVFLQDADSLVVGVDALSNILIHLRSRFPSAERITSYSRSSTINKMSAEELSKLCDAGLSRIHVGMESGSDNVLKLVKKGASKKIHIAAGLKVKASGMELSEYVMPGLGGRRLSREHALESADALNKIDPDFIRLRPLAVPLRAPLFKLIESGTFEPLTEVEVAVETRLFIESLEGISSQVVSDHVLNLLGDLNGQLPEDHDRLLGVVDRFLSLAEDQQVLYVFGRRLGAFNSIHDMSDTSKARRIKKAMDEHNVSAENIDEIVAQMKRRFI